MDIEQKRKRTVLVMKWLGGLVIGFFVAPFIWIAIGGIVGMIVAAAISFVAWKFNGWFAMKVANWRLKAIKAEAAKNPVETLQNEHKQQSARLEERKKGIEVMSGAIRTLDETIDKLERDFPDSPELEQMNQDYEELKGLEQSRRADWQDAFVNLGAFAKEIQRVSRIWDVAQAAARARQQSGLTEGEWESKLKTETSLDAIRTQLNTQLSALSTEKMQADADRVLKGRAVRKFQLDEVTKTTGEKMQIKKITTALIALLSLSITVSAQTNTKPTFINGTVDIRYNTRIDVESDGTRPKKGVVDNYALNLNVCDSALFKGTVTHLPTRIGKIEMLSQVGKLTYNVDCYVVNPANPAQSRSIGRMTGVVPIDSKGAYRFSEGTLKVGVNAAGRAQAFESRFDGVAFGKPPKTSESISDKLKRQTLNIQKQFQGKMVSISVTNYDKMTFQNHVLAAGPVQTYPDAKVSGEMVYDYERLAWYFQNVEIQYVSEGNRPVIDRLTGNIRWVESPNRKVNGEGEYQFDVRLNEATTGGATESAVFAKVSDENAFFQTDDSVTSLTGTMKYKDTMAGENVTASSVVVDLKGNRLTKQQTMNLCKLLLVSSIVPLNAE